MARQYKRRPYVAAVYGVSDGVPFRNFYKNMKSAENAAKTNPSFTLLDTSSGNTKRWNPKSGTWGCVIY